MSRFRRTSSCPALCRASTNFIVQEGRRGWPDKPGDDEIILAARENDRARRCPCWMASVISLPRCPCVLAEAGTHLGIAGHARVRASASASALSTGKVRAVSSRMAISRQPGVSVAIIGRPQAAASSRLFGSLPGARQARQCGPSPTPRGYRRHGRASEYRRPRRIREAALGRAIPDSRSVSPASRSWSFAPRVVASEEP